VLDVAAGIEELIAAAAATAAAPAKSSFAKFGFDMTTFGK